MQNIYQSKLEEFYRENKRMPTYSEMMGLFGFKSKNAVFKIVEKMVDAGLVAKDHLGRLIPAESFGEIPKLGFVTAGFPASVEEELVDTIKLDDLLIQKKNKTYLLTVDGDSMIDAHIDDGDMVLVEKTNQAKDGDIVIANVDGEFTMKYLRKRGDKSFLEPANKNYKPIYPTHSLEVVAVLKAVVRKY
ncbi:MAG: transcriptional repressor LexA [Candidatus Paceibacterota bacterium]|jgi:repressor LexA